MNQAGNCTKDIVNKLFEYKAEFEISSGYHEDLPAALDQFKKLAATYNLGGTVVLEGTLFKFNLAGDEANCKGFKASIESIYRQF